MAVSVVIGGLVFRTKGEAKQFFRGIRDRYPDGARLGPEDDALLRELLACHPEAADKAGAGVAHFTVVTDAHFGRTRHFTVHRVDGSSTDFSYHSCIDGRNERRDRLGALRRAVEDQIVSFRERAFAAGQPLVCPLRGVEITRAAYHVDHTPPAVFDVLVQEWLLSQRLELTAVPITPPGDNQIVAEMTDTTQLKSWWVHHRQHARLRLLSPRANLSEARRE
jgi:hypothetical protein